MKRGGAGERLLLSTPATTRDRTRLVYRSWARVLFAQEGFLGQTLKFVFMCCIAINAIVFVLQTDIGLASSMTKFLIGSMRVPTAPFVVEAVLLFVFFFEYTFRVALAIELSGFRQFGFCGGRVLWAVGRLALLDAMCFIPLAAAVVFPSASWSGLSAQSRPGWAVWIQALRLVSVLKLERYVHAVTALAGVCHSKRRELAAATAFAIIVLVLVAVLLFLCERGQEGSSIRTMRDALWFATVTISTIGYGDMTPVTVAGKAVVSVAAFAAIAIFGLPAALVAAGLMEEVGRARHEAMLLHVSNAGSSPASESGSVHHSRDRQDGQTGHAQAQEGQINATTQIENGDGSMVSEAAHVPPSRTERQKGLAGHSDAAHGSLGAPARHQSRAVNGAPASPQSRAENAAVDPRHASPHTVKDIRLRLALQCHEDPTGAGSQIQSEATSNRKSASLVAGGSWRKAGLFGGGALGAKGVGFDSDDSDSSSDSDGSSDSGVRTGAGGATCPRYAAPVAPQPVSHRGTPQSRREGVRNRSEPATATAAGRRAGGNDAAAPDAGSSSNGSHLCFSDGRYSSKDDADATSCALFAWGCMGGFARQCCKGCFEVHHGHPSTASGCCGSLNECCAYGADPEAEPLVLCPCGGDPSERLRSGAAPHRIGRQPDTSRSTERAPGSRFGKMCAKRCCGVGAAGIEKSIDSQSDRDAGQGLEDGRESREGSIQRDLRAANYADSSGGGRKAARRRWRRALKRASEFSAVQHCDQIQDLLRT